LKILAVVFICNAENVVVQYFITFLQKSLSFVCAVLETALSRTCFEFC